MIGAMLGLVVLAMLTDWWAHQPRASFRRHFGSPIPHSVSIRSKWGCTGLAGSSEFIVFSISTNDLDVLIARHNLKPVSLTGQSAGRDGTNVLIDMGSLSNDIATARQYGITPVKGMIESKFDGMVYYLLLIDDTGTNAMYHYSKP